MLTLDCRGQRCPMPVIELARRITEVGPGETIQVDADDPAAPHDIAAWCRMRGHTYEGAATRADGSTAILVRRASDLA